MLLFQAFAPQSTRVHDHAQSLPPHRCNPRHPRREGPDCRAPHLGGGRRNLARKLGKTVDEICAEYDLSLAEVHAALAHYYDHQAEIERDISEGDAFVKALRDSSPSKLAERRGE